MWSIFFPAFFLLKSVCLTDLHAFIPQTFAEHLLCPRNSPGPGNTAQGGGVGKWGTVLWDGQEGPGGGILAGSECGRWEPWEAQGGECSGGGELPEQ